MSGATFGRLKNWGDEVLTNEDLNDEIDNILENFMPQGMDDYSVNAAQMKLQTSPGTLGNESLAVSTAGELERLRYVISRVIFGEDVATKYWYEEGPSSIQGLFEAFQDSQISALSSSRIVSGRSSAQSSKIMALIPVGNQPRVLLGGQATPFVYIVEGQETTISTNLSLDLAVGPSSQHTARALYTQSGQYDITSDDEQIKFLGEYDSVLNLGTLGTNVTAKAGQFVAFKTASTDEIIMGFLRVRANVGTGTSTHELVHCRRGAFFDNLDFNLEREYFASNELLTLLNLHYVFAKQDGTLTSTTVIRQAGEQEPAGASAGDYWFDTANRVWKKYSGTVWDPALAMLIGYAVTDATNCIAARTLDVEAAQQAQNTIRIQQNASTTQIFSEGNCEVIYVNGRKNAFQESPIVWDPATDMAYDTTFTASRTYFLYITEEGGHVISARAPHDRLNDLLGWYHPAEMWRCVGQFYANAASEVCAPLSFEGSSSEPRFAITQQYTTSSSSNVVMMHAPPSRAFKVGSGAVGTGKPIGERNLRVPGLLRLNFNSGAACGRTLKAPGITGAAAQPLLTLSLINSPDCGPLLGVSLVPDYNYDRLRQASETTTISQAIFAKITSTNTIIGRKIPVAVLSGGAASAFWDEAFSITPLPPEGGLAALSAIEGENAAAGGALWALVSSMYTIASGTNLIYYSMANNSITLPAGLYECKVEGMYDNVGPIVYCIAASLGIANGNDTTTPAATTGITFPLSGLSQFPPHDNLTNIGSGFGQTLWDCAFICPSIFFQLTQSQQIFVNTRALIPGTDSIGAKFSIRARFQRLNRIGS